MEKIVFEKLGQEITIKIAPAFLEDGYRVLVSIEGNSNYKSWIAADGESDRIFKTKEEAETAVIEYANKLVKCKAIKFYNIY